jgi:hypothetical protein
LLVSPLVNRAASPLPSQDVCSVTRWLRGTGFDIRAGRLVSVNYDAGLPECSVLEPGVRLANFILFEDRPPFDVDWVPASSPPLNFEVH